MKYQPISVATKAWIDDRMPLRVRNVPKIDSAKAPVISAMFQTLSMPLRSCTITECRKAVATSHGISAAFSTGSQAQKPPQPTSVYAQCAPSSIPMPRKPHDASVQRRDATTQRASVRPASIAATASENGMASPT